MQINERKCYKCRKVLRIDHAWSGLHPDCFCEWFEISQPEDFQDVVARSAETSSNEWSRVASSFFHGKFRKYSATLGGRSYLLKVQQSEFPELPAMEYLCNQLAGNLGLWVPDHFYIRFQNELDTFVCENFMGNYSGSNLIHIFRFLKTPNQYSCEGLLRVLEDEIKRMEDIHRFIQLCIFDALIGNHDRHGRNIALIQLHNEYRLAPFYDNPSYLALEDPFLLGALHEPRGAIATQETLEPTMRDYVKEWTRLGYNQTVLEFTKRIDLLQIEHTIHESYMSLERQKAFFKLIQRRYQELCDAIQGT